MPKPQVIIYGEPNFIRKDLTGKRFGKLVALKVIGRRNKMLAWLCKCDCGNDKIAVSGKLIEGGCTHCGCMYVNGGTKHSLSSSPIYKQWIMMRNRCNNPNGIQFKDWGGRGIKVCKEWDDFKVFHDDMISSFKKGLLLDRKENDKGYYKENCRWVDRKTQNRNRRSVKWYEVDGIKMILADWLVYLNISPDTYYRYTQKGKPFSFIYNRFKK